MRLKVNGTTLYCETIGDGAPCLCLHGGPGTDSSGLSRSLAPLAEMLDLQLVLAVSVLGISWGGFLGLMYAARHPASVRALAVVGASASRDFMRPAEENARRRGTPRLDLPAGTGRGDPPPDPALDAGRVRAQRPLAARRGAGGVRRRARRYFPVQRAALSDW